MLPYEDTEQRYDDWYINRETHPFFPQFSSLLPYVKQVPKEEAGNSRNTGYTF